MEHLNILSGEFSGDDFKDGSGTNCCVVEDPKSHLVLLPAILFKPRRPFSSCV